MMKENLNLRRILEFNIYSDKLMTHTARALEREHLQLQLTMEINEASIPGK